MNNGGEAADQMVREALQFSEVAIKLTALGFKNSLAIALAYAKENPKVRDLAQFKAYAKQYGVLFASIKDKGAQGEKIDIMFKAEDVSKLNRIYEQLGYTVPKKISADRKNAETRRQTPDPMLTRGKTMEDIDPRPSFKTVAAQLRKAAARSAERAVNATRKEER